MPSDLRPLSVTLVLSMLVERLVVRDLIMPNVSPANLYDKYGFKPTGSTTATLVDLTHTVTVILETNKYVRCLLIDFSKAFHSVDHAIVVKKLVDLGIDQNIIDWVVSFLSDRQEYTKVEHKTFGTLIINRSIVQGSGVGPSYL